MLFIVSAVFSVTANAASFDFAAIANMGEYGAPSIGFTDGGITVTATAPGANAYLDAGNAGLGVCQVLGGTGGDQCVPGNDDNIESGENLVLTFNGEIELTEFSFVNGAHQLDFTDGFFSLFIDGIAAFTNEALANGVFGVFTGSWIGTEFSFVNTSADENNTAQQFYLSGVTAVPVPAALFLFAPALLGFMGLRRKAKLAA